MKQQRLRELAKQGLVLERQRLQSQLADLDQALQELTGKPNQHTAGKPNRRPMSAEQRKLLSEKMTAFWATKKRKKKTN